jgi:hypothetical protein
MPQADKKKRVDRDQTQKNKKTPAVHKERKNTRTAYLITSIVIIVVLVIVGVAYYMQQVVPFQRTVITFDDTVVKMRYFLERAKSSGSSGMGTLQSLTNEMCIREGAARIGIAVTPQDIDNALREQAAGSDNITVSDEEFKEWYRQLLNDNGISDERYREIKGYSLLATRLQENINNGIPSSLDHAHVYIIYGNTYDELAAVKERVDAGENFSKVAREISLKVLGEENDGEYGWIPKGGHVYNQDPFLWETGKTSTVLAYVDESSSTSSSSSTTPSFYYVLHTSEVESRAIDPSFLSDVRNTAFQQWLTEELKKHSIHYNYDSEIDKWISWQLSKNVPSSKTTTSN